jgi:tRNA A-37 threonylcarbamoyl transferase component Bud32
VKDYDGNRDPTWYVKYVDMTEVIIMQQLKGLGITPEFKVVRRPERLVLYIKRYPCTLAMYFDRVGNINKYREKIKQLVQKLHENGIIHHDLHRSNIVLDPKTDDVRLIDFGESFTVVEFQERKCKNRALEKELDLDYARWEDDDYED